MATSGGSLQQRLVDAAARSGRRAEEEEIREVVERQGRDAAGEEEVDWGAGDGGGMW